MDKTDVIKRLLLQVSEINKKYDEIAKITGENFNIFRILKIHAAEVGTHSALLCEMLNPYGSHGCGDVFLKLFLEQQKIDLKENKKKIENEKFLKRLEGFSSENCIVTPEAHIGFISEDGTEGGRIDILLKDKNNKVVIIENKIHAGDQKCQLLRYNNAYPEAPIFYLTLEEKDPSIHSTGGNIIKGDNFVCITYRDDICKWLLACKEKAVNKPILRETITQYINLIKFLTHQTMNDKMNEEIIKTIFSSKENIEAALSIDKSKIQKKIIEKITGEINTVFEETSNKTLAEDYTILKFEQESKSEFLHSLDEWKYSIYSCIDKDSFLLGISRKDESKDYNPEIVDSIKELLKPYGKVQDTTSRSNGWIWCCLDIWTNLSRLEAYDNFANEYTEIIRKIYAAIIITKVDMTK